MKYLNFIFLALVTFVLSATEARAMSSSSRGGWSLPIGVMYILDSQKSGSTTTSSNRLLANATFGYTFNSSPIFLGATYDYDDVSSSSSSLKRNISSYGATVGVYSENVYLLATYLISSDYKADAPQTSYSQGTGFNVRLGYLFSVGSNVSIGPELSYRSIKWTKTSTGATADYQYDTLLPYLVATFTF